MGKNAIKPRWHVRCLGARMTRRPFVAAAPARDLARATASGPRLGSRSAAVAYVGAGASMNRLRRTLGFVGVLTVVAPPEALANRAACAAAADDASVLRRDVQKLTRTRDLLLVCVAEGCDADIRDDCRRWLEEVEANLPTVVFVAEDDAGQPVLSARVLIDGKPHGQLDGNPVPVDPGQHTFTFERDGGPPVDVRTLVRLGKKNAEVLARFPRLTSRSPPGSAAPAASTPSTASTATLPPTSPPTTAGPTGFVFGAHFVAVPYAFLAAGTGARDHGTSGVSVGFSLEGGYAFSRRAEILARALGAVGSECGSATGSNFFSIGPALSVRLVEWAWVGVGLLGGQARSCTPDAVKLSTNVVFSPTFDLAFAVVTQPYGQWMVTSSVGYYFANITNDNRVVYAPIGFGLRLF